MSRTVLGSFRLLRVLGQGSFATAYLAEQIGTDRKAVVKIAHAHLIHSDHGRMVRDRFASEVRASTRVSHPNLVTIYTAGETDDGLPALAMEYLDGETLGRRLRRGERLRFDDLHVAFTQLASALQRTHASRIIHRDVSPENVFLTHGPDGFALKLLDFGIARLQDLPSLTNYAVGTPFYMALEQMKGAPTTASDVYSVGALLWWCITGTELFGHLTELAQLLYHLETQQAPPDARTACPTLPAPIAALVGSMLHRDADARPTMGQFLASWAAVEPELRAWWAASSRGTVAVLSRSAAAVSVVDAIQRQGYVALQLEPRVATLLAQPELHGIVIDAELREPDPLAFVQHLTNVLPDVRLCAFSTRAFTAAWSVAPVRACALLPEQLPLIAEALRAGERATPARVSSDVARRALGEIPELLAGLEECVTNGAEAGCVDHCERLERIAHLASLHEIGSLARTLRVLLAERAVDDPAAFVEQLNRSYHESFPALLAAHDEVSP